MVNMNIELISLHSEEIELNSSLFHEFYDFCKTASLETDKPAHENMMVNNWQDNPASLLHLLLIEQRFKKGNGLFNFLKFDNKLVAVSGIYRSYFHPDIFIGGVRSWLVPEHRSSYTFGNHVFPEQLKWAKQNGGKQFLLTFNEYNKKLATVFLRVADGKATGFGKKQSEFYKGFKLWPNLVNIMHTPQWVLYKNIDDSFNFNFDNLGTS